MITHDPNRVENPTRADSTSINIGPRAAIDLFYWTDAAGKLNAVIDPRHGFEVPRHTKRTSFSVGAIMEMMLGQVKKDQEYIARRASETQDSAFCWRIPTREQLRLAGEGLIDPASLPGFEEFRVAIESFQTKDTGKAA